MYYCPNFLKNHMLSLQPSADNEYIQWTVSKVDAFQRRRKGVIASQIAGKSFFCTIVFSGNKKENVKARVTGPLWGESTGLLWGGIHGHRWSPLTKGKKRGKRFYVMTSSCPVFCQILILDDEPETELLWVTSGWSQVPYGAIIAGYKADGGPLYAAAIYDGEYYDDWWAGNYDPAKHCAEYMLYPNGGSSTIALCGDVWTIPVAKYGTSMIFVLYEYEKIVILSAAWCCV